MCQSDARGEKTTANKMLRARGTQLGYNPILGDCKHANDGIAEMQLCYCYCICKGKGKHEIVKIKLQLLSIQEACNEGKITHTVTGTVTTVVIA